MSKGSNPRPISDRKTFDSEFDRIFGPKQENPDLDPETGRVRYKAHPETGAMIPDYMWAQFGMLPPPVPRTHMIMRDVPEYESPVTGKRIGGRRQRRYDMESTGTRAYEGFESESRAAASYRAQEDRKLSESMERSMFETLNDIRYQNNPPIERNKRGVAKNTFTFGED